MTIVAILKETTHNVLAQIGKAAKRITLYHASSQGCMAGVINIMHGCYTSKKAKKKEKKATQIAIFTEQKKRGIYKQTRTHTCIQSTHTIIQQSPSVTHSVQSHNQFRYTAVASSHTLTVTHDVRHTA